MSNSNSSSSSSGNSGNSRNNGNSGSNNNSDNVRQPGNSGDSGPRRKIRERRPSRIDSFPPGQCICNRPNALVICNVCGFSEPGRVRYPCPVHHQVCYP